MRDDAGRSGARQRLWAALRRADRAIRLDDLTKRARLSPPTARQYVAALEKRGYLEITSRHEGRVLIRELRLIRNTGPRAPGWSIHTDAFRDWNLDPAMTGEELGQLIDSTGLTLAEWLTAAEMHPANVTRLRHMRSGQRPVSEPVAAAATRLAALVVDSP